MPGGTCHALQCFSLGLEPRVDYALIQDDWPEPGHAGRPTRPGSGQTMFLIGFPWMASGGGVLANPPTPTRRKTIGGRRGVTFRESNMMDIYRSITDRILKQLEAGQIPWRKTWSTGMPKSLTTGKEYRGLNIVVFATVGFASRYWITYRRAQRLGGHVRKGEKAMPVIYWKWRTAEDIEKLRQKTGKETFAPCVPFLSSVFNLDQVEGIARPDDDIQHRKNSRLELAENVFAIMPHKPEIAHATIAAPAYSRLHDRITLPNLSQFESADEYYATLFHELAHSTGHPRRLNRFADSEGDRIEKYSFEELVAEFAAAFLCAFAGISNPVSEALQASYIEGWARVFRQDNRILIRAAAAAQRAADYIRGKVVVDEQFQAAA